MRLEYDKGKDRILHFKKASTPEYWDDYWYKEKVPLFRFKDAIIRSVIKHLPQDSLIIEAGCGRGQYVQQLTKLGYNIIGIDNAPLTITNNKRNLPGLDFSLMDIRKLEFENSCIDGYISLGVIEHFYEGYTEVLQEMDRVLKKGGYAIITFPVISAYRRSIINNNGYAKFKGDTQDFFNFILDEQQVIKDIENMNYELIELKWRASDIGLMFGSNNKILQYIYKSNNIICKVIKLLLKGIGKYSAHSCLLVFKKK